MKRLLFRLARTGLARQWISWVFAHMSFIIPTKRLRETNTLIAFHHPQPSYPFHVLIVPKSSFASLLDVSGAVTGFWPDLLEITQSIVREYQLESIGYRLITNGGSYQDVPHLHFHLISDSPAPAVK